MVAGPHCRSAAYVSVRFFMKIEEVKAKWPYEYKIIECAIKEADGSLPAVAIAQEKTNLNLEDFKRIVLSIQCGMTLEQYECANVPYIKQSIKKVEIEWHKNANKT